MSDFHCDFFGEIIVPDGYLNLGELGRREKMKCVVGGVEAEGRLL